MPWSRKSSEAASRILRPTGVVSTGSNAAKSMCMVYPQVNCGALTVYRPVCLPKRMRWLMCVVFVVAWSSGFVGATLADRTGAGTWTLLAWRYLVTALVLLVGCLLIPSLRRSFHTLSRRQVQQQVVLAVLSHVLFLGGVFLSAEQGLDAGLSALVCALQPLLVTAAGRIIFGDRVSSFQWVGLLMALGGVALSVGGISTTGLGSVSLVVVSLLGLSAASLLERSWQPRVPVVTSLTVQVSVVAVIFSGVALLTDGLALRVTGALVLAISWLVFMSGLGGYAMFIWCLRHVGATTTSTLLYLTAPTTMLWAWSMFGQQPLTLQWIGLAVVLSGVGLATRGSNQREQGTA
ncbi:DMT family transporter [Brevibacterium mcbrellneri]